MKIVYLNKIDQISICLTRLRRLNRTSLLPSSWNLDKIFALTDHLAQVQMSKKIFSIFLHAGRGKRKGERSGMICSRYNYLSFFPHFFNTFVARSVEQETSSRLKDRWYETRCRLKLFFM